MYYIVHFGGKRIETSLAERDYFLKQPGQGEL